MWCLEKTTKLSIKIYFLRHVNTICGGNLKCIRNKNILYVDIYIVNMIHMIRALHLIACLPLGSYFAEFVHAIVVKKFLSCGSIEQSVLFRYTHTHRHAHQPNKCIKINGAYEIPLHVECGKDAEFAKWTKMTTSTASASSVAVKRISESRTEHGRVETKPIGMPAADSLKKRTHSIKSNEEMEN